MRKVIATRHQNSQNAYTYSRTTPEVFFGTAARSSFGQLNTQKDFSYADVLRSGTENPLQSNLGTMEFMSFMKTTMQTLVQNQNIVLQLLAGKQSK